MVRYFRIVLAFFAVIILAFFGYLGWSFYFGVEATRSSFVSGTWKEKAHVYAHNNDPGCVRGDMALDLVAINLLQGRSTAEVKSLLGEPDGVKEKQLNYELGQCSGYGWYNSILEVSFRDDQVVDVVISTSYLFCGLSLGVLCLVLK